MTRLKGNKKKGGGKKQVKDSEDEDEDEDDEDESESDEAEEEEEESAQEQGGLKTFEENWEECKLVLVVRTDLGMGKGIYTPLPPPPSFLLQPLHQPHQKPSL